jgi:hypothetical protein
MISTLHFSPPISYHSMTFVAAIVALAFFVVSMIVIPSSQLAIAVEYTLHDHDNKDKQNGVGSTASTKTMMMTMMPATPPIATKTKSISRAFPQLYTSWR